MYLGCIEEILFINFYEVLVCEVHYIKPIFTYTSNHYICQMRPTKTYEYIVVLKKKSTNLINLISILMLVISVLFFVYNFINQFREAGYSINSVNSLMLLWIIGIAGWIAFCQNQQKRGLEPNYRFALLLAAWGWFMLPQTMWLAGIFLIAAVLEKPAKVAPEYAFDTDEIVFNSFPQKKYSWAEVSNVVLRFGMLTIDFKNNKIIQGEVNNDVTLELENEFNEYCKNRINNV